MDLGADRVDPLSVRPVRPAGKVPSRPVQLIAQPRSWLSWLTGMPRDPLAGMQSSLAVSPRPAAPSARSPSRAPDVAAQIQQREAALRALESRAVAIWLRLSLQHKITAGLFGFWFLLATGLLLPVIVVAIAYASVRRRAA